MKGECVLKNVRVFYNKTGNIKYISHLDMNRFFMRILRRSGIPIWYTEGFNPHPRINFSLPLSLGLESTSEIMDIRISDDDYPCEEVAKRLSEVMPSGLTVTRVDNPIMKIADIAFACFTVEAEELPDLTDYFNQAEIITMKRTKSGTKPTDIKPMINNYLIQGNTLLLTLSAGAVNLNPNLVISTAEEFLGQKIKVTKIIRTDVLNSNFESFK